MGRIQKIHQGGVTLGENPRRNRNLSPDPDLRDIRGPPVHRITVFGEFPDSLFKPVQKSCSSSGSVPLRPAGRPVTSELVFQANLGILQISWSSERVVHEYSWNIIMEFDQFHVCCRFWGKIGSICGTEGTSTIVRNPPDTFPVSFFRKMCSAKSLNAKNPL